MEVVNSLRRWGQAISLFLFCIVWVSFQWDVLRGLVTQGPSVVDTLYETSLIVMLLVTLGALVYEIRRTVSD